MKIWLLIKVNKRFYRNSDVMKIYNNNTGVFVRKL